MLKINYEAWVRGETAKYRVYFTASGNTPQEVKSDAAKKAEQLNAGEVTAVGLNNRESDWIAVFGAGYSADCKFADST
jgi:hypothetical protein